MAKEYFIINKLRIRKGPFTIAELKGKVSSSTLVWKQGMEGWKEANTIKELAEVLDNIPPAKPKPQVLNYRIIKSWIISKKRLVFIHLSLTILLFGFSFVFYGGPWFMSLRNDVQDMVAFCSTESGYSQYLFVGPEDYPEVIMPRITYSSTGRKIVRDLYNGEIIEVKYGAESKIIAQYLADYQTNIGQNIFYNKWIILGERSQLDLPDKNQLKYELETKHHYPHRTPSIEAYGKIITSSFYNSLMIAIVVSGASFFFIVAIKPRLLPSKTTHN